MNFYAIIWSLIVSFAISTLAYLAFKYAIYRLYTDVFYKAVFDAIIERFDEIVNTRSESIKAPGEKDN